MKKNYHTKYWENDGKYQKQYQILWDKLIPPRGSSSNDHGELLRCIVKLHYDVFNNGLCNWDVLYGEREFVTDLRWLDTLKNYGLKENQWDWVYKEFTNENITKREPYTVKNFVIGLEGKVLNEGYKPLLIVVSHL